MESKARKQELRSFGGKKKKSDRRQGVPKVVEVKKKVNTTND